MVIKNKYYKILGTQYIVLTIAESKNAKRFWCLPLNVNEKNHFGFDFYIWQVAFDNCLDKNDLYSITSYSKFWHVDKQDLLESLDISSVNGLEEVTVELFQEINL